MDWINTRIGKIFGPRPAPTSTPIGDILQDLVSETTERHLSQTRGDLKFSGPRKPHTLRAWLAHDFAEAYCWDDLQSSLKSRGYCLAKTSGQLSLLTCDGEVLCTTSDIGQPASKLMRRFGAPLDASVTAQTPTPQNASHALMSN